MSVTNASEGNAVGGSTGTVPRQATFFDRLSILFLAIDWTIFGSMHFSLLKETTDMLPGWVPEAYKPLIVTGTGMIEVATGILILLRVTRWWAAAVSLALLIAYIPVVYYMLAHEPALAERSFGVTAFRVGLVPHNIFLGICSVYLLQNPAASLFGPMTKTRFSWNFDSSGLAVLLVAALLLLANSAGFLAILVGVPGSTATASMWAMMCIATGALIGFLFAVPRVNPAAKSQSHLLTNTNIEQVSDWLTKILVGVGLINFKEISGFIDRRADLLAASLAQTAPAGKAMALSLIVYFFVVGLIQGYLLTRLFLSRQFLSEDGTPGLSDA
jgi:uncharacterized membrane protein